VLRRAAIVVPCALWLLTVGSRDTVGDPATAARFHDERARRYYAARRHEEALREFFLVQRLAANPRVAFNIALCFRELHRNEDAFVYFAEYLASTDDHTEFRTFAQQEIERIIPEIARLRISSDPPGATIYVDTEEHGAHGSTPCVIAVKPGEHELRLHLPGHRSVTEKVTARLAEEVMVRAELSPLLGGLEITATASSAVRVLAPDGLLVLEGTSPFRRPLRPGIYRIEVRAEGRRPWISVAQVRADSVISVHAELDPLPPPTGDLTVTANIVGAVVFIDGEPVGFTPVALNEIPAGHHRLDIERPGLRSWSDSIIVSPDERVWVTTVLANPEEVSRSTWTWIIGGAGGASLLAGGIVGALALVSKENFDDQRNRTPALPLRDDIETGRTLNAAADSLIVAGAIGVLTGVVLYFVTEETRIDESRASIGRTQR